MQQMQPIDARHFFDCYLVRYSTWAEIVEVLGYSHIFGERCLGRILERVKGEKGKTMKIPEPLPSPDFSELIKLCQEHIDFLASDDYYADNDNKQYIYEAAIEAVFGKNVWKWINRRMK